MLKAFYEAKVALAKAALFTHPHTCKGAPTALTTDDSDEAMGAVLHQRMAVTGLLQ